MKSKLWVAVVAVTLTVGFAFLVARATETNSPPSQDTSHLAATPYKSNAEGNSGQNSTMGRFQIISGQTWFLATKAGGTSKMEMPVMVKLDTETGRAWVLVMESDTNGTTMGFAELPDVSQKKNQ